MFQLPQITEQWKDIANYFGCKWNFENCIGSIDSKHINTKKPQNSGSTYYNYKGTFSIVLMAIVDANYQFIMVYVGSNGRISDGGVLYYTKFWEKFQNHALNIPPPPFSLQTNLMKPYSQHDLTNKRHIFNYRLS